MDATAPPDESPKNSEVPASLRTMTTQLRANPDGSLGTVMLEENELHGIADLRAKLKEILDPSKDLPFEQALIQADPRLKYEELMKVVDVFSSLKLTKISFAELDAGASL